MGIVLGLSGCVDFELQWDHHAFQRLVSRMRIQTDDLVRPPSITTLRDLVVSICTYMREDSGGEEYVPSKLALAKFAEEFQYRQTLGGTPVRAGIALARMGIPTTVHVVSYNNDFAELSPSDMTYIYHETGENSDPHIIIQYPSNELIAVEDGEFTTRRSNRLIYVNDLPNSRMDISKKLKDYVSTSDVFLYSGINGVRDELAFRQRARQLREIAQSASENSLCVYEEAGFHVDGFQEIINAELCGQIDVRSMNEDEAQRYLGRKVDLSDVGSVVAMFAELGQMFPHEIVVIHTQFWAGAVGKSPRKRAEHMLEPLQRGVALASARLVWGDDLSKEKYQEIKKTPLISSAQALCAKLAHYGISAVPSIDVVTEKPTTIGLGDTFCGGMVWGLADNAQDNCLMNRD